MKEKIAKDNDYILALKGNHPLMEQKVKDFFLKSCNLDSDRPYYLTGIQQKTELLSEELSTTELRCSLKWIRSV